jgi:hypothetical protein
LKTSWNLKTTPPLPLSLILNEKANDKSDQILNLSYKTVGTLFLD